MENKVISSVHFELDINPAELTTAQEKGVRLIRSGGKMIPMFYKKAKAIENERMIDAKLKPLWDGNTVVNDGNTVVELFITYYFPHTKGTPRWKQLEETFMTQRPDADNLSKAIVDRMTHIGFFDDDSMVDFHFAKRRSPTPRIEIDIIVRQQYRKQ